MTTLIEIAKHAGLPVRMATLGDLVRSDSHDPTLAHLNPRYVIPEGLQTSEKEAAEMLIDYIIERLDAIERLHSEDEHEEKQRLLSVAIFLRRANSILCDVGDESFYADYKRATYTT